MIALGSDHAGLDLKLEIIRFLEEKGFEYKDLGTYTHDSCDYPVYAEKVALAVASGEYDKGILVCGTGIGVSIAANKVKGIRCALCSDCFSAEMASRHNNANVIALGGRTIGAGLAEKIVLPWLTNEFEGGRHFRRVSLFDEIANRQ
jgi:ribose 5-phosphate isomerase B